MFNRIAIAAPIVAALLTSLAPAVLAEEFTVDHDSSLLAFVNHKRGIASGLIVDPLTYPGEYDLNIALNPSIESATFTIRYDVKNIQVAGSKVLRRWGREILDSGATRKPRGFDYQAALQIVRPELVRVLELDQGGGAA